MTSRNKDQRRFAFISSCPELWGGSEELWSRSASHLAKSGHKVAVFKTTFDKTHPSIVQLKSLSCRVRNLRYLPLPRRAQTVSHFLYLTLHLKTFRPDLVVISQGDNYDALHFAYLCRKLNLPYTLISQKATDHFWPQDKSRKYRREIYGAALHSFFVSEHNLKLTEEQNGGRLSNASVVRNPFLVSPENPLPWPGGESECLRLACVARLYLLDKGQDILLRVLAREKWKQRSLHVSFFGQGINRDALVDLAEKLGITNVSFEGQTTDVPAVWQNHHMLILPSRTEGLPLSLVEAMMCGRPAIVTNVGGNTEVVEDGINGFVGVPAVDSIDDALERAWQRRNELREMGLMAANRIREIVPANPEKDFADLLLQLAEGLISKNESVLTQICEPDPAEPLATRQ